MYRTFIASNNKTSANIIGLKFFLKDFTDIPSKKFSKLSIEEVNKTLIIHELSGWQYLLNKEVLHRQYQFQNFQDTFSFMGQVSQLSEQMKHYPKWFNKNSLVTIDLTTPEAQGVTIKDFILAYSADHIAAIIGKNQKNSIFDSCDIHVENLISSWNGNYQRSQEFSQVLEKSVNFI